MDKRKKNKTNKKKGKTQELSIGNLRKTEVNCAQCQKQLFGLWKNESFQSCLECSSKKSTVLTMLKSMNRVCEVRINNPVADNTVKSMSDDAAEIEQSKAEESDVDKCAGRKMEKNKKRFSGDTENKDVSPDQKEEKTARRTRRSSNLNNPSVQHQDDCKNNLVSNEPVESDSDGKPNNVSGTYRTGNVENGRTGAVSTLVTRKRNSSAKDVLDKSLLSDVTVANERTQENSRSKNDRKPTRLCTRSSVENNINENKNSMQCGSNKRRQQVARVEENSCNKLRKGGEKGREPKEVKDSDNSNSRKVLKRQSAVPEGNKIFNTTNENSNSGGSRRRQQSSLFKENVSSESRCEEILENKKLKRAGRIHVDVSPENKNCDSKSENEAQTDVNKRKKRSVTSNIEIKRLKIDLELCDITDVERVKRRSSNDSQNKSPGSTDSNKNLVSVADSKKRTRVSLNIMTDKTASETEPVKSTVLVDRASSLSQGLENLHHSEDEKQNEESVYENKRERRKSSETKILSVEVSTDVKERRRPRKPVDPKRKPPLPVKTLELLRATRGMKPVVLVERMITVKQKVVQQPAKNKKRKRFPTRNKRRKVYNFNKKRDTSNDVRVVSDDAENKNVPVSVKSEQPVSKKDKTEATNEVAYDPKQKPMALRALRKREYNQSKLSKLSGNIVRSERKRKNQGVKNYRSTRLRNAQKKKLGIVKTKTTSRVTVRKETEVKARNYVCDKCKKQFVSELQQKSHELTHRGYYELKLKRIDTDIINKTEGELISKEIVNYVLKSVFATETDNFSEDYRNEACDNTDTDKNIPKESCNHSTETKYELKPHLRSVQLVLKRIDLREAVAMNKHNEGILVATSVVNDILKTLDNKTAEECVYKKGEVVNIGADNYNKTREVESSVCELEENINDECQDIEDTGNVNLERCKDGTVDTDFTENTDCKQTDSQSQKLTRLEECNKLDDNCKVINNNENKQDKHESNSRSESELCAEDDNIVADKTKSDASELHRNTDYDKYVTNVEESNEVHSHSVDCTVDKRSKFINKNEHPESSEISDVMSDEDTESLVAETGTSSTSSTGIRKGVDTYLRNKDNEKDNSTESGTCKSQETEELCSHKEENEHNKVNEITETMMNASVAVGSGDGDSSPELSTKTNQRSYIILDTESTEIVSDADEADKESEKEKTENSERPELENITGNEEIFSSAVESNVKETDSDNSEGLESAPDKDVDNDFGTNVENIHHTAEDTLGGDSGSDSVEINIRLSISSSDDNVTNASSDDNMTDASSDDNMKNVEDFIGSSAVINVNDVDKDKESMVNSRSESPGSVGDSEKIRRKDKQSVVSIQEESSVSKQKVTDKTFDEVIKDAGVGSETGDEQMLKSENELKHNTVCNSETNALSTVENITQEGDAVKSTGHTEVDTDSEQQMYDSVEIINNSTRASDEPENTEKMFSMYQVKIKTSDFEVSRSDDENYKPQDTVKSEAGGSCDEPLKQEIHDTLESMCNTENNKSVSDNRNVCSTIVTNVSANIEDCYTISKQETESMLIEASSQRQPDEQHITDLSNETNILDLADSQNTDIVTRNDSLEVKHFNTPCDTNNETKVSESRKEDLTDFGDSTLECFSSIGNESYKSRTEKGVTDGSGVSRCSNGSDRQFFISVSDSEKPMLENASSNFSQIKITEGKNSKIDNQNENVENTFESALENEATNESNYKNVEKYFESFFKDLIVRETESNAANIENQFDAQQEKLSVTEGTGKSSTERQCTSHTTTDYMVTAKSGLYNDSLQNITGMLLEEICSSSDMERKSQRPSEKEATISSSSAATVMNKEQVQSGSRNKTSETEGDIHRQLDIKSGTAPPPRYVSDTAAMTSRRHSLNDETKADTQRQFYSKNETDFSGTSSYSMDNTRRQSNDRMQTILPSANNHVTYTVQKQPQERRETDLSSTDSHTDSTRRYSGDRRPIDFPATGSESIRKHTNDRREADYSMAGSSNAYQRPVNDNRRHYVDPHDTRQYMDTHDNRGNLYGPNWRHQTQNRMHPYQHNPHKRNDRGGYSNWRWPGPNNYSHFRHGNNWR